MDILKWGFIALFLASCGAREQSFNFCVVHITAIDESSLFTDACPLNTFYVEVIYQDSTIKYWYD